MTTETIHQVTCDRDNCGVTVKIDATVREIEFYRDLYQDGWFIGWFTRAKNPAITYCPDHVPDWYRRERNAEALADTVDTMLHGEQS